MSCRVKVLSSVPAIGSVGYSEFMTKSLPIGCLHQRASITDERTLKSFLLFASEAFFQDSSLEENRDNYAEASEPILDSFV